MQVRGQRGLVNDRDQSEQPRRGQQHRRAAHLLRVRLRVRIRVRVSVSVRARVRARARARARARVNLTRTRTRAGARLALHSGAHTSVRIRARVRIRLALHSGAHTSGMPLGTKRGRGLAAAIFWRDFCPRRIAAMREAAWSGLG